MLLCIRGFLLVLSISFVLLYICEGKLDPAPEVINPPECSDVKISADANSGQIFDFIKGIEWINCTFELDSQIRSSGALVVIRIFAIELHTPSWSEIVMPAGDHIPHNITTPNYREGELPWCGIYLKKESSRLRATNEGLCPGSIYKSQTWPPKLTINAKSLRLSLWYAFLDCRNKARPVDVDEIDADIPVANDDHFLPSPFLSSTGPPAPAPTSIQPPTPITCTEASTEQNYQNVTGSGMISYEKEFNIALIAIGVLFLSIVIISVILVRICTKKSITPVVVVEKAAEPNSPTYRQYDQVSTLPKRGTNHSFRPHPPQPVTADAEDSSSNYQYIDLPVFANSPTSAVPPDHHRMFTNTTSINETLSDCTSDKPMMSTSSELVANELYHLPKC